MVPSSFDVRSNAQSLFTSPTNITLASRSITLALETTTLCNMHAFCHTITTHTPATSWTLAQRQHMAVHFCCDSEPSLASLLIALCGQTGSSNPHRATACSTQQQLHAGKHPALETNVRHVTSRQGASETPHERHCVRSTALRALPYRHCIRNTA